MSQFLRRELDFYIKNEVMHLDDVEGGTAPRVEQYLSKIKAIRRIAHKLIDFLAQIENFQGKLWLKKKFVVQARFCVTLDRLFAIEDDPTRNSIIEEVIANEAQREEWKFLYAIDETVEDLVTKGYSEPLTIEFLEQHATLVVDTRHFSDDFRARLTAAIPNLDDETDGVLIESENFQALSLLAARYGNEVNTIYIDPPYNTGNDDFLYKDDYQHSSWLAMFTQTLASARPLMSIGSAFFASCDDNEMPRLRAVLDGEFGQANLESQIIVQSNKRGQTYKSIAKTHEYLLAYDSDDSTVLGGLPRDLEEGVEDQYGRYELWELRNRNPRFGRFNRPNLYFPIYASSAQYEKLGYSLVSVEETSEYQIPVYPQNSAGEDSCWRWSVGKVQTASQQGDRVVIAKQTRAGAWRIFEKSRKANKAPKSIWTSNEVINEKGTVELGALGLKEFGFPKPLGLLENVVRIGMSEGDTALDYFAGTGTTGHAIIKVNREDDGERKFILIEMGNYFESVLVPRIKKATYTPDWKDGKPLRLPTQEEVERSPKIIKVLKLESYEDTLNNLLLKRTDSQQALLDQESNFREDYALRYMLDVESRGSSSLLNVEWFSDPFNYQLDIATGSAGATSPTVIDLVETFNYLLGLRVKSIREVRGVRVVAGTNAQGGSVLVLWRNTKEISSDALDEWFRQEGYNSANQDYDVIFVNGDNSLENLRRSDQTWKVRLTEDECRRLMFETV
ncbi:site-specific DNA-methyltransferase [Mycobacterium sp. URHB0021]